MSREAEKYEIEADYVSPTETKKLRILCLHGFKTHKASFAFMTEGFRKLVNDKCDFMFMDGTYSADENKVIAEPKFLEKGFKPPFKGWMVRFPKYGLDPQVDEPADMIETADHLEEVLAEAETPTNYYRMYYGVKRSILDIVAFIEKHGPFDGFLAFSEGASMIRMVLAYTQIMEKESFKHIVIPRFVVTFGGEVFDDWLFKINGRVVQQQDYRGFSLDSLHVFGTKDPFHKCCEAEPK